MTEPTWKTTGESPDDHYEDEAAIAAQEAWEEAEADAMRKDARDMESLTDSAYFDRYGFTKLGE